MPHLNRPCGRIDHWVDDGFSLQLGETTLRFLSTPGHTPGQGCWYDDHDILVGDTLFAGSIGRTDFPRGDYDTLITSIREKLWPLGDDVTFIPGHGPTSTFGQERQTNPFVADSRYG